MSENETDNIASVPPPKNVIDTPGGAGHAPGSVVPNAIDAPAVEGDENDAPHGSPKEKPLTDIDAEQ